ncbi:uncharacterized protein LOC135334661 isoform X2 [Halichondria panicea]
MSEEILEKSQEILELQTQLAIPQDEHLNLLETELAEKNRVIVEKQARIEQLVENKVDSSEMLARYLGEKEALLSEKNKDLMLEKARVNASKTSHAKTRRELEKCRRKLTMVLTQRKATATGDPIVDVEFDSISKPGVTTNDTSSQTTTVNEDIIVQTTSSNQDIESTYTFVDESDVHSSSDTVVQELRREVAEKAEKVFSLENQLKEANTTISRLGQVKDHSKGQSKALFSMRQELDATKMSHDELVQYITSLEQQVADTEKHTNKLEATIKNLETDKEFVEQALVNTRESRQALVESTESKNNEIEAFRTIKQVMESRVVEMQEKLEIITTQAEVYKEDFETERKDREKAHNLKEEMRLSCDQRVHAMTIQLETERLAQHETIQTLRKRLERVDDEKSYLEQEKEARTTRSFTRQQEFPQKNKEIHELQEQLYEAQQKAITAQEEVQAKTAQVKQYKKKDDQREKKLVTLDARNQELIQEMERVRSELERVKTENANLLKEEKKSNQTEMNKVRQELERALKRMSKSEAHDELLKVQLDNHSLHSDNEKLNRSLQKVQEQFAGLKVRHLELKKEVTNATPTTPPEPPIPIHPNQVSVKQDIPQGRSSDSSDPTAKPKPDQQQSVAQQPTTIPNVNIVPPTIQDNYNQQPEARLVPNLPTEGLLSMNFENPRSAHDSVEVNGFRNAAGRNERQSSTGPQPDNSIRYPPGLQVKQSHSSAPSSTNLALSEQVASPTDASNKMSLVLGDQQLEKPSNMPSDFNQSHYPANTNQGGDYQDPVNNYRGQSGSDNLPQCHYQYQNQLQPGQPQNVPPSNHPSQWPNQQPYVQDHLYQQQAAQPGPQYEQPRSPHYNPQQQNYGQSNYNQQHGNNQQQGPHWCNHDQQYPNSQWESNQQYQGAGQQAYNYPSDGLQPQQYNTIAPSYPSNFRDDDAHSPVLNNHNSLSENTSNSNPNVFSRPSSNGYGVDISPEKPKPKPRAHCKPDTPSPVSNPETQKQLNPNRTELLVKPNGLQDGIDREISEVAAAVSQVTRKEGERDGAPLDPNLVCPMCMKQYRIGEIQLYRAHVNKCDGTRH